jgi:hypothetical protein
MKNPHEKFYGKDSRKKELVVFRCDQELFSQLRQEAQIEGIPISETIRTLCSRGLQ